MPVEQGWWPDYLYWDGEIVSECAFFCDGQGVISRLSREQTDLAKAHRLKRRFVIPGLVNGHSHAFQRAIRGRTDRKSTRLNSSHTVISYAVFCLKKKKYKAT